MKVWIEDQQAPAEAFSLEVRGLTPARCAGRGALRDALEASSTLSKGHVTALKTDEGLAASLLGREGHVLLQRQGERAHLHVRAWGDPSLLVRTVEALCLRLQPTEVRLQGASLWSVYPPFGALFVRTTHQQQSEFQHIEVGEHPVYGRMLFLNGETQIATSDEPDYSAALVDAGLRKRTRRACILGGGDCGVLRELLSRPQIEEVVMVEIDKAVVEVAREHFPGVVGQTRDDPRGRIIYQDANLYLEQEAEAIAAGERTGFDLIVYDLSDAPLEVDSLDELCGRVKACLALKGRVAVQCGSGLPMYADDLAKHRQGIERHFRKARYTERVIPSFLEQPWIFASARA